LPAPAALAQLPELVPQLTALDLSRVPLSPADAQCLQGLQRLSHLSIGPLQSSCGQNEAIDQDARAKLGSICNPQNLMCLELQALELTPEQVVDEHQDVLPQQVLRRVVSALASLPALASLTLVQWEAGAGASCLSRLSTTASLTSLTVQVRWGADT
jgi:hypothetical protein